MALFNAQKVRKLYDQNLSLAKVKLAELNVYCGRTPNFGGLSGWVFEQTIQYCLRKELNGKGVKPEIAEQVSLGGRAKADLVIGKMAIKIKTSGLFGMGDVERYRRYRGVAQEMGLTYLFFTQTESYAPYHKGIVSALGAKNVFFLDEPGNWNRFVTRIVRELRRSQP